MPSTTTARGWTGSCYVPQAGRGILPFMCRSEPACQLALGWQKGEAESLDELYRLLSTMFVKFSYRKVHDRVALTDIVTDVIIEAATKFDPDRGCLVPFASRKLGSRITDWYRREERRRKREVVVDPVDLSLTEYVDEDINKREWALDWPWILPRVTKIIEDRSNEAQAIGRMGALHWIAASLRGDQGTFTALALELKVDPGQAGRWIRWVWAAIVEVREQGEQAS